MPFGIDRRFDVGLDASILQVAQPCESRGDTRGRRIGDPLLLRSCEFHTSSMIESIDRDPDPRGFVQHLCADDLVLLDTKRCRGRGLAGLVGLFEDVVVGLSFQRDHEVDDRTLHHDGLDVHFVVTEEREEVGSCSDRLRAEELPALELALPNDLQLLDHHREPRKRREQR